MNLKLFKNIWVVLFAGIIATTLLLLLVFVGWVLPPAQPQYGEGTVQLTVFQAATTTRTKSKEEMITEATDSEGLLDSGGSFLEKVVQIYDTGGDGLRLRSAPGISSDVQFLGDELELFEVKDGPVEEDGYTWWYLESPYDSTRSGWAAANYLKIINETE